MRVIRLLLGLVLADRRGDAAAPAQAADRVSVVASFSILGDFVQQRRRRPRRGDDAGRARRRRACLYAVAGRRQEGRGCEAHRRQRPRPRGLAAAAGQIVAAARRRSLVATKGIAPLKAHDGHHGDADPHAWQSVANAKIYVANIRDALVAADPADAAIYRSQCRAYLAKLDALDREVRRRVAQIPPERRKVISTHEAFGYFAAAYGIAFIAPQGVSTESEPSARDIAAIITQIRKAENSGGFPGKYQRSAADAADRRRDRRQDRRHAVFGQFDRRKGRCPHLH